MIHGTSAGSRLDDIAVSVGSSSTGGWLTATLRRLMSSHEVTRVPRDKVREAAEVRAFAESVRATDPHFANDLCAAADRHEIRGI